MVWGCYEHTKWSQIQTKPFIQRLLPNMKEILKFNKAREWATYTKNQLFKLREREVLWWWHPLLRHKFHGGKKQTHHELGFIFVNGILHCQPEQVFKNGFDIADKCSLWEEPKGFGGTSGGNATCYPTLSRPASKEW